MVMALAALGACASPSSDAASGASAATAASVQPSDPNATAAARTVLGNLHSFDFASGDSFDRRIMIGQQDTDISDRASYGTEISTPDVVRLTGRAPALVSYELSDVDRGATSLFDVAGFRAGREAMRELITAQHDRGALVSLVWHMRCPKALASDPDAYAPDQCPADYRLSSLRSGGVHFAEWRALLDELAELLWSLNDANGELIPVQLRPFHEFAGDWFWWGRQNSAADYIAVWQEMVAYLRDGRGLHNVLWVFAPNSPSDSPEWQSYYPGDADVDVVAFDRYDDKDGAFAAGYAADLREVAAFSAQHQKAAAVAEVGIDLEAPETVDPSWFTSAMLAPLRSYGFAYVGLWRNAPWEKFIPEPNDGAIAADFTRLGGDPGVLFAGTYDLYRPLHAY